MRVELAFGAAALISLLAATTTLAADKPEFSFVVLGHLRGDPPHDVHGELRGDAHGEPHFGLAEIVDQVAALSPDIVFLTGDLIWGDVHRSKVDAKGIEEEWERLDAALAGIAAPIYRVPGNHDINDPVTRDIFHGRYGEPHRAFTFRGSRFILLNSTRIPPGPASLPRQFVSPKELTGEEREFLSAELSRGNSFQNVFVFMHHLLWWDSDATWWARVHPLLLKGRVRAVFSGEYGPLKFSHLRRDGIDYLQSAIEGHISTKMLRAIETSRVLTYQFDNFLHVRVRGREVDVEVKVVGATSWGKYTPERWHEVYRKQPLIYRKQPLSLRARIDRALGGALRRTLFAGSLVAAFVVGLLVARWSARRRTRDHRKSTSKSI